ncbi:MAG TPA: aromatic ring-hydroxylating dioxygenase subunit alpha [Chloroflexota bacterium]|nr:aromatic ring-hydroxylating dioxygenase subunit alpha [Chloroflexota bacterium]
MTAVTFSASDAVVDQAGDFRVHRSIYADPAIFELEMQRIFERTWVFVAHESELPNPGDYVTTTLGTQPVIVSRGPDDDVHVMLNRCRHRGSVVCRAEKGHATSWTCPYHGWVYACDGALEGIAQASGYPDDFLDRDMGLVPAPRVGVYRGLIFASMSATGESLDERLAQVAPYIDFWADRSPLGKITLTRGAHKFFFAGNWKFQLENGSDGYHGNYVHESFLQILDRAGEKKVGDYKQLRSTGSVVGLGHGDGFIDRPYGGMAGQFEYHDPSLAGYHEQLRQAYGAERAQAILGQRNLLVFPNLYLFESHIRVIRPLAVDRTVVLMHPTRLEGVDDALNTARLRTHERFFGPAGFGAPDDVEMFVNGETGMKARSAQWVLMSRGLARESYEDGVWRGGHSTDESPQRSMYREWKRFMSSE